jgi:hypothetical protein
MPTPWRIEWPRRTDHDNSAQPRRNARLALLLGALTPAWTATAATLNWSDAASGTIALRFRHDLLAVLNS